jgi:hypothetical protein
MKLWANIFVLIVNSFKGEEFSNPMPKFTIIVAATSIYIEVSFVIILRLLHYTLISSSSKLPPFEHFILFCFSKSCLSTLLFKKKFSNQLVKWQHITLVDDWLNEVFVSGGKCIEYDVNNHVSLDNFSNYNQLVHNIFDSLDENNNGGAVLHFH